MAIGVCNEGTRINSNINVTPMVDVMLVLLIIFMVITPMLSRHGVPVDLTKTSNPIAMSEASKPGALILSVMRDGKMFLGSESVTSESLVQRILGTMATRPDKTVFIRADARTRYGTLVKAVDDLRSAGVDQLGLLTEQRISKPGKVRERQAGLL